MSRNARALALVGLLTAVIAGAWPAGAFAATQPRLGTIVSPGYTVVAGSTITNTGPTVITGNLALSPGSAVTGFTFSTSPGPGQVTGNHDVANGAALQAQNDLGTAFTDAANAPTTTDLSGTPNLGNQNLIPGVYAFSSSAALTGGALTLSGNGVFIFKIGTSLTTASNVLLTNGAQACAVFWEVGSSATLGTGTTQFQGNLMAHISITMVTGTNILTGRALAQTGALTLDTNRITPPVGACTVPVAAATPAPTVTPAGSTVRLPNTGGPPQQPGLPWLPLSIAVAISALLFGMRRRTHKRDS